MISFILLLSKDKTINKYDTQYSILLDYKNEKEHVKMHQNVNFGKFKCEICEKVFNLKQTLGTHLKTHSSNRKKIVCSVEGCSKTFHKVAGLERHE